MLTIAALMVAVLFVIMLFYMISMYNWWANKCRNEHDCFVAAHWLAGYNFNRLIAVQEWILARGMSVPMITATAEWEAIFKQQIPIDLVPSLMREAASRYNARLLGLQAPLIATPITAEVLRVQQLETAVAVLRCQYDDSDLAADITQRFKFTYADVFKMLDYLKLMQTQKLERILSAPDPESILPSIY